MNDTEDWIVSFYSMVFWQILEHPSVWKAWKFLCTKVELGGAQPKLHVIEFRSLTIQSVPTVP